MISSGNQNLFPSFFAPLGDLLKALVFLSNLNGFNSFPLPLDQGFAKRKGSSKVWKEKGFKLFPFLLLFLHYLCVLLYCFKSVQFYALLYLTCFYLFIFQFCFILLFTKNKNLKNLKNTKTVCFCVHVYLCTLDGH